MWSQLFQRVGTPRMEMHGIVWIHIDSWRPCQISEAECSVPPESFKDSTATCTTCEV